MARRAQGGKMVLDRALVCWESDLNFKQCYEDQYWGKQWHKYLHNHVNFIGPMEGPPQLLQEITPIYDLFHKFLLKLTLEKICRETN